VRTSKTLRTVDINIVNFKSNVFIKSISHWLIKKEEDDENVLGK